MPLETKVHRIGQDRSKDGGELRGLARTEVLVSERFQRLFARFATHALPEELGVDLILQPLDVRLESGGEFGELRGRRRGRMADDQLANGDPVLLAVQITDLQLLLGLTDHLTDLQASGVDKLDDSADKIFRGHDPDRLMNL